MNKKQKMFGLNDLPVDNIVVNDFVKKKQKKNPMKMKASKPKLNIPKVVELKRMRTQKRGV